MALAERRRCLALCKEIHLGCNRLLLFSVAAQLLSLIAAAAEKGAAVLVEVWSLVSTSIALEAACTGFGGGSADEGRLGQRFFDASDETISKLPTSTL